MSVSWAPFRASFAVKLPFDQLEKSGLPLRKGTTSPGFRPSSDGLVGLKLEWPGVPSHAPFFGRRQPFGRTHSVFGATFAACSAASSIPSPTDLAPLSMTSPATPSAPSLRSFRPPLRIPLAASPKNGTDPSTDAPNPIQAPALPR